MRASLKNVRVRLEHYVPERDETLALVLTIDRVSYQDTTVEQAADDEVAVGIVSHAHA